MLSKIKSINGDVIFGIVDNRGKDLFVSLTYSNDVSDSFKIFLDAKEFKSFKNDKECLLGACFFLSLLCFILLIPVADSVFTTKEKNLK